MEMDAVRIEEYEKRVLRVMVSEQKRIFERKAARRRDADPRHAPVRGVPAGTEA